MITITTSNSRRDGGCTSCGEPAPDAEGHTVRIIVYNIELARSESGGGVSIRLCGRCMRVMREEIQGYGY